MNEATDMAAAQPKSKPTVKREYLLVMNAYDAWTLCDWSGKPTARLADLLSLPSWEVIKKHGL
jgi:hypothetical protein